ncbi:MAG: hypothetical protein KDA45_06190 [Planctomycetales bacterium]|nr:hypothetical protein [Planctomycetales bacterium]
MNFHRRLCAAILACAFSSATLATAQDGDPQDVADGPWISAVAWQDGEHLLGTRSAGLLFRPAQVVRAAASDLQTLEVVGEAETSLWAVQPVEGGGAVASDYRGGVHLFQDGAVQPLQVEARWIRTLQAAPQAGEVLAGTEDGKLLVLSLADAKETKRIDAHQAAIFDIAVSDAGDKIATAAGDGTVKIFSWPQLEALGEMSVGKEAVWSVLFVNNDRQLVSGGADRGVQLWDVASARPLLSLATAPNWITTLVALPESDLVVAGCMDGSVLVVDWRTMHEVAGAMGPGSAIWSMALAPDGRRLALGTRKHGLAILDCSPWPAVAREAAAEFAAIRPPAPPRRTASACTASCKEATAQEQAAEEAVAAEPEVIRPPSPKRRAAQEPAAGESETVRPPSPKRRRA